MKAFNYLPIHTNVYSPVKKTVFTFDKGESISIGLTEYIDLDEFSGEFYVRNFFTGSIMILSDRGPKLKMNKKILKEFINDQRFEKTEYHSAKGTKKAEDYRPEKDSGYGERGAYG